MTGLDGPPGPTALLLVRHGRTALTGARYCGRTDPELSPAGHAEARLLADRLPARAPTVAAVISSPLQRALHTAGPIAARYGLPVQVEPAVREIDFGCFEGSSFAEAAAAWPAEHAAWLAGGVQAGPPGGESLATVADRAWRACARIVAEHPDQTVVLVSHSTPVATLLCAALAAPLESVARLQLSTAGLSWIDFYGPEQPVVRCVNDTSDSGPAAS